MFANTLVSRAQVRIQAPRSPSLLPAENMTVYPDRENYFVVPDEMMVTGTGVSYKAVLVTSAHPIVGKLCAQCIQTVNMRLLLLWPNL